MGFITPVWENDNVNFKAIKFCLWLVCCFSNAVFAGEYSSQITHAELIKKDTEYALNADIEIPLSPNAKKAINSSIILSWRLQLELKQQQIFWDKVLLKQEYIYQIRYHALLNSYSVSNQTTGSMRRFSTLNKALKGLSQIRNLKLFPHSFIKDKSRYHLALKLFFDRETLPVPLIATAYLDSEWDLSSQWYLWNLNQPQ